MRTATRTAREAVSKGEAAMREKENTMLDTMLEASSAHAEEMEKLRRGRATALGRVEECLAAQVAAQEASEAACK